MSAAVNIKFTLVFTILAVFASQDATSRKIPHKDTEYLQAFHRFSTDLLSIDPNAYKTLGNQNLAQITGLGPVSIGHILALLNEQKEWDIPAVQDFANALHLRKNEITEGISAVYKKLSENDPNIYAYSSIYTPEDIQLSDGLKKLGTSLTDLRGSWDDTAAIINSQIAIQTFGHLFNDGDLVPYGNYGTGIGNHTRSVLVDTVIYSNEWHSNDKFTKIESRKFADDATETEYISYDGVLGYHEDEKFFSVGIPLKTNDFENVFVMVQPKMGISETSSDDLRQMLAEGPEGWSTGLTNLEFPAMNFSFYGTLMGQLSKVGIDRTFCNLDPNHENFVQQMSQRIFLKVNENGVVAASATGIEVNRLESYPTPKQSYNPSINEIKPETFSTKSQPPIASEKARKAEALPNFIKFDQPFFWYLHHKELGPLYFGSILSLYQFHITGDMTSILELQSQVNWSCQVDN